MALVAVAVMVVLAGCSSSYSNNTYTYGDASPAVTALINGLGVAALTTTPGPAYHTGTLGTSAVFNLAGYFYSPYTLTGSITESGTPIMENGTVRDCDIINKTISDLA